MSRAHLEVGSGPQGATVALEEGPQGLEALGGGAGEAHLAAAVGDDDAVDGAAGLVAAVASAQTAGWPCPRSRAAPASGDTAAADWPPCGRVTLCTHTQQLEGGLYCNRC